jgi:GNAT superfamily N-acetyltransferase
MNIAIAKPSDLADIAALYAEAGYGAAIDPADTILVVKDDAQLIGVVRLCPEHGAIVLRGMQIRSVYQRQGIGAQLLTACQPYLDQHRSYCLPYAHLLPFYGAAGFTVADNTELPNFLVKRLASYLANGKDVIAMHRLRSLADTPHAPRTMAQ